MGQNKQNQGEWKRHNTKEYRDSKEILIYKIELLEKDFGCNIDPRDKDELKRRVDDIIAQIDNLNVVSDRIYPIDEASFRALMNSVKNASFINQQKDLISIAATHNYFLVDQVIEMANITGFDNDKITIIQMLYPQIIDYENNYRLFDCLRFNQDKLSAFIKRFEADRQNNSGIKTPPLPNRKDQERDRYEYRTPKTIEDQEINLLIQNINQTSFEKEKLRLINTAAENNYFTVKQVYDIIRKLVTTQNFKLNSIKTLYPKVIDPENNAQLYNCLTFDTDRDNLRLFINKYDSEKRKRN
jgi:hypothetical protein